MRDIFTIALREITTRIKGKAFIVSNIITVVIIVAVMVFIGLIGKSGDASALTGMVDQNMMKQALVAEQAKDNVLNSLGVSTDEYNARVAAESAKISAQIPELSDLKSGDFLTTYYAGYIVGYAMFMLIIISGTMLAQGVAEEKANSIAEVILGSTSAFRLLAGKIIGVGILGLLQVAIIAASALIPALYFDMLSSDLIASLSSSLAPLIAVFIGFFIVGYLCYSALLAAFAATIKRAQDVNAAITPVNMIAMIGLFGSLAGGQDNIALVLNYCPLLSPFAAPAAFARGSLDLTHTLISLLISCAFLPVIIWFASKLYSNSILNTGSSNLKFIASIKNTLIKH